MSNVQTCSQWLFFLALYCLIFFSVFSRYFFHFVSAMDVYLEFDYLDYFSLNSIGIVGRMADGEQSYLKVWELSGLVCWTWPMWHRFYFSSGNVSTSIRQIKLFCRRFYPALCPLWQMDFLRPRLLFLMIYSR